MDEFDIKLGGWLEEQRKARHLSQAEVARRMKVTKTAVYCALELGRQK